MSTRMPARRPFRRALSVMGIVALAIAGLLLASTAANLFLEQRERANTQPYGERVEIEGGSMNVYRTGKGGQPIVLLSGLATPAPALDFAPLIRELDPFDVTVVEGFGYGYSDMTATDRTVENISTELHEVLSKLDIPAPYVLLGHSIAGFYTLDYANRYPDEVAAVVGIDTTVPSSKARREPVPSGGIDIERLLATVGVVRAVAMVAPGFVEPDGDAFTRTERDQMRMMQSWNFGNAAVADETRRIGNNAAALKGMTYPDDLPVLTFLAGDKVASAPEWLTLHEEQLRNVTRHEVVVLDGGHYLHWTQSHAMAEKLTDFLAADVAP